MALPLMRHKPRLNYSGLTIVLSNPSRLDSNELISGTAGHFFENDCLRPDVIRGMCDIRTSNTIGEGLLPCTRGVLLLGHRAMLEWTKPGRYKDYSLNEQRGCPLENIWNVPMVASYFPQDAIDPKDYESEKNQFTLANAREEDDFNQGDDSDDKDEGDVKKKGKTRRGNWRFWLQRDTKKILSVITEDRNALAKHYETIQHPCIYPTIPQAIAYLQSARGGSHIFMDIETHPETGMLYCIGFCVDDGPVYVLPVFRYNGIHAYDNVGLFFRAYISAIQRNTVVCHNGFTFDLLLLACRYRILFGRRNEDSMIMTHRCWPEVEKSLGHAGSLWTWDEYHKDEGCYEPQSPTQETTLWHYNAKDVILTRNVWRSIRVYAPTVPGLSESIQQGNDSIYSYMVNTLHGLSYNADELARVQKVYDRLLTQYLRFCRIALGRNFLPSSNTDVPQYFNNEMGYKVIARTKKGKPAYGKDVLYKLKLMYPDNIMIDICLKYRALVKASGSMKFNPWSMPWKSLLQKYQSLEK